MGDQLLLLSLGTEQELCYRGVWEDLRLHERNTFSLSRLSASRAGTLSGSSLCPQGLHSAYPAVRVQKGSGGRVDRQI